MGSNQYWAVRVYDLCVCFMTGTPEGSTEGGFMDHWSSVVDPGGGGGGGVARTSIPVPQF